jgi:DNA mismatch repair protein MutL
MSLTVDGSTTYRLPAGGTLLDRIRELFGQEFSRSLRPLAVRGGEVDVAGLVSAPQLSRADRAEQYFFINGRATSAPILNHAVREAYRAVLAEERHPCVFLHMSMDPELVDVNVHPTKREVRFRHPSTVRDAVIAAIRDAVALPAMRIEPAGAPTPPVGGGEVPREEVQLAIENLTPARTFRYPRMGMAGGGAAAPAATASPSPAPSAPGAEAQPDEPGVQAPWSWCRVLGQVGGLYVVMETEDGMVLMDPKAAHERVLFDRLMRQVEAGDVAVQALLIPETVELTPKDAARLRRCLRILRGMGFGVSDFGGNSFVVDAVPACLTGAAARDLLQEVPHALEQAGRSARAHWQEELIAQTACRAAVGARRSLTLGEIERLVVDLARTQMPYTSPRGRPTLIFTSLTELNRKFGRT